jgi:hypothetical protein
MFKHLIWVIGLVIIVAMLCLTAIWINAHSWTIRFETDENTLEAIKSINWTSLFRVSVNSTDVGGAG